MRLITLRLVGPDTEQPDPHTATELLAAHIVPDDRIEHVRVRAGPGRIDLAAFLLVEDEATALLTARAFCIRALATIPSLAAWHLAE
jgi:hypothetical protein